MTQHPTWRPAMLLAAVLAAHPVHAMDATALSEATANFMQEHLDQRTSGMPEVPRLELQVTSLDPRLNVPDCAAPLQFEPRDSAQPWGRVTVRVSCASPAWSVFVPVEVKAFRQVLVTLRPLPKGSTVGEGDINFAEKEIRGAGSQYFSAPQAVLGKQTRRQLSAGTVLGPSAIQEPLLIRRGDTVRIQASTGGINISMDGKALANGRAGDSIQVENSSSGKRLRARVVGPGQVSVSM